MPSCVSLQVSVPMQVTSDPGKLRTAINTQLDKEESYKITQFQSGKISYRIQAESSKSVENKDVKIVISNETITSNPSLLFSLSTDVIDQDILERKEYFLSQDNAAFEEALKQSEEKERRVLEEQSVLDQEKAIEEQKNLESFNKIYAECVNSETNTVEPLELLQGLEQASHPYEDKFKESYAHDTVFRALCDGCIDSATGNLDLGKLKQLLKQAGYPDIVV